MIGKTLHLGLDLGGDSLKISYAYQHDNRIQYGKIIGAGDPLQIGVPAIAYYDVADAKWYYADQIDQVRPEEYITVVKVKSLISMLSLPQQPTVSDFRFEGRYSEDEIRSVLREEWQNRLAAWEQNKVFYASRNEFPKFYFPNRRGLLQDFAGMVEREMTFQAPGYTPRSVCSSYFYYVHELVERRRAELEKKLGHRFSACKIALVHPAGVGDEYLSELSDLVEQTFGYRPGKTLSANKALALYAQRRGTVSEGERFLVFDMGEESISVAQAGIVNGEVCIDGVEGHSAPCPVGGNDIDEAIVRHLENRVMDRETFGTPSFGEGGHIQEESAFGKQYLLMKDVKKAKVIFDRDELSDGLFADGVPLSLRREVMIQCKLTKEDLMHSLGITRHTGVAKRLADYIAGEAALPINRGVRKVFLSGGALETYGLQNFIAESLQRQGCSVELYTYDDGVERGDNFAILSHEDSVFSAAVGGAIVSLLGIELHTVFSLSYACWINAIDHNPAKHLSIFANRGDIIDAEGTEKYSNIINLKGRGVSGEEIYSCLWTVRDVGREFRRGDRSRYSFSPDGDLEIGAPDSQLRRLAEDPTGLGLKVVSGGSGGKIRMRYDGQFVALVQPSVLRVQEGIRLDKYGNATPIIRNCTERNLGYGEVIMLGNDPDQTTGPRRTVLLTEIEPIMMGLSEFKTSMS